MRKQKLSIIIPVYNEQKTIQAILNKILDVNLSVNKELILINDGSKDNSKQIIENYIKQHQKEKIILINKKNGGKGSAIKLGFEKATGDIYIVQDADLEYEPQDYNKLIKPILDKKSKVVYGSRFKNKKLKYKHLSFLIGNIGVNIFLNLLYFQNITDSYTCYKVFHKELKPILTTFESKSFDFEAEITAKILKKKYKIIEVPINYYPRSIKEGKKIRYRDGLKAMSTYLKWRFKKIK